MKSLIVCCLAQRWAVIALTLISVGILASGIKQLEVRTNYDVYFDGENARLASQNALEDRYGELDNVLIAIASKDGNIFDQEDLIVIQNLTQAMWLLPYMTRVDSLTNYQYVYGLNDELVVEDLFGDLSQLSSDQLAKRKSYALSEPSITNIYVNHKGDVGGVIGSMILPANQASAPLQANQAVEQLVNEYRALHPDLEFYLTGSVAINQQFFNESTRGTGVSFALSLMIVLLVAAVLLRSFAAIIGISLLTIASTLGGIGLASYLGIPFTASSSPLPLIVSSIIVANCVHILSRMNNGLRMGLSIHEAIINSYLSNWKPVTLTLLTTAIGFLCLNHSDVPPYRYLGNMAAICIVIGLLLSFTLLPALLSFGRPMIASDFELESAVDNFIVRIAETASRHHWQTIGIGLLLALVSTKLALDNEISDSLVTYFDEGTEFRDNTDFYMENHSYFYTINLPLKSGLPDGVSDPQFMYKVEQLTTWLRTQPEVKAVISYTDFIKNINRAMHANDQEWYRLPDDKGLAAQYLLLYEMSIPYGLDLSNQMALDKSEVKIIIGLNPISSVQLRAFDQRLTSRLGQDHDQANTPIGAGATLMFAYIWRDSIVGNIMSMLLAIMIITLIITLVFRSPMLGLISVLPNLLPTLMAFAFWRIVDGKIDIGAAMVMVVSFGIVVDDTVHILSSFKYGLVDKALKIDDAIKYAYRKVGRALLITTVILTLGFAVLIQSSFTMNSHMGMMTCVLICFAIILDFVLLPAMLKVFFRSPKTNHLTSQRAPCLTSK